MATINQGQDRHRHRQGDVHDIGKKHCHRGPAMYNFVVNMGVMVPCSEILAKAKAENAGHHRSLWFDHAVIEEMACRQRNAT